VSTRAASASFGGRGFGRGSAGGSASLIGLCKIQRRRTAPLARSRESVLPACIIALRTGLTDRHQQRVVLQSAHVRLNMCEVSPKFHGFGLATGNRRSSTWSVR